VEKYISRINRKERKPKLDIYPVILAGGSGKRLWPISDSEKPKQFSAFFGESSLYQNTIERLDGLDIKQVITLSNMDYRFIVAKQTEDLSLENTIILEPFMRNTAPAIALAAFYVKNDPILLVLPADHIIKNNAKFTSTIKKGISLANDGKLVTFGVIPSEPNTGYGYIEKGKKNTDSYSVKKFIEKPDLKKAKNFFESEKYLWNSGIFIFRASRYLSELKKHRKDIYRFCRESLLKADINSDFIRPEKNYFKLCPSESIDYAVMEKTSDSVVIPLDLDWSDVGSWKSMWDASKKDHNGNTILGNIKCHNTSDSYIRSDIKNIITIGLKDIVIVSSGDSLLVADKDSSQDLKIALENKNAKDIKD
tara:strand:+ start:2327 stop:3421 length:1095 start_codon:yes stop_codon:yes gene_type:complete